MPLVAQQGLRRFLTFARGFRVLGESSIQIGLQRKKIFDKIEQFLDILDKIVM
jgi:hypothetical protein